MSAKTDDQIKSFFIDQDLVEHDDKGNRVPITADEIQALRVNEQPELQDFVDGKPSKEEFSSGLRALQDNWSYQFALMWETVSFYTALWLFLGVGTAFKLASGASGV